MAAKAAAPPEEVEVVPYEENTGVFVIPLDRDPEESSKTDGPEGTPGVRDEVKSVLQGATAQETAETQQTEAPQSTGTETTPTETDDSPRQSPERVQAEADLETRIAQVTQDPAEQNYLRSQIARHGDVLRLALSKRELEQELTRIKQAQAQAAQPARPETAPAAQPQAIPEEWVDHYASQIEAKHPDWSDARINREARREARAYAARLAAQEQSAARVQQAEQTAEVTAQATMLAEQYRAISRLPQYRNAGFDADRFIAWSLFNIGDYPEAEQIMAKYGVEVATKPEMFLTLYAGLHGNRPAETQPPPQQAAIAATADTRSIDHQARVAGQGTVVGRTAAPVAAAAPQRGQDASLRVLRDLYMKSPDAWSRSGLKTFEDFAAAAGYPIGKAVP